MTFADDRYAALKEVSPGVEIRPREARPRATVRVVRTARLAFSLLLVSAALGGSVVRCPFAWVFHTPCPTCGSARTMLALAAGDVRGAMRYNPLAPFTTLLVVLLAVQALASVFSTGTFNRLGAGVIGIVVSRGALLVAILEMAIWLARWAGAFGGPVPV